MRNALLAALALTAALAAGATAPSDLPAVVPAVASVEATEAQQGQYLQLGSCIAVTARPKALVKKIETYLQARDVATATAKARGAVSLEVGLGKAMTGEQYTLRITPGGFTLVGGSEKALYYGCQTLAQLIRNAREGRLPLCTINDEPRFGYRGLMIDVVRCYLPLQELERLVDVASELKINNVHLHLTDDNGWRLEIKKYPRLAQVGAWRVDRPEIFPARLNARSADEPATYGGVYTQKEMRQLVKYAAERHVNIVPEIEMPAHSAAAIASYPSLACPVVDKYVGVFPGIGGKDASIIICAGNPDSYKFYQDVLDEVVDVFPSKYIHLGGDEARKDVWQQCPLCQKAIADHHLADEEALQAFFMDSINHYLRQKGRTAIGWDEASYGDPKEEMVMMGWQGDGGVAVRDSRRSGRHFILTPAKVFYLIRYQGPQWFEPYTYFGNSTLADAYGYEPVGADWDEALESRLMGVQGSLWGEFCRTPRDVQHQVFPRLLAVADVAWRPKGRRDWPGFLEAVDGLTPELERQGVTPARSMWNIQHRAEPDGPGRVKVSLECIRPDAEIRYALGDSALTEQSALYTGPLTLDKAATLYAATFANGRRQGATLELPVRFNRATGCKVATANCTNSLERTLTNGVRGRRNSDFEWAGWHNTTGEFTLDLGSVQPVQEVKLGAFVNSDICCALPGAVTVYASRDGNAFYPVASKSLSDKQQYAKGMNTLDLEFASLPAGLQARYLRFVALNPGAVPDGMAREGAPTWLYFDEITVK